MDSYFDTSGRRPEDVVSGGARRIPVATPSGAFSVWTKRVGTDDPGYVRWMAEQLPNGRSLHWPDGSHLSECDDPEHHFPGLIDFLTGL